MSDDMKAFLILADGTVFEGTSIGAQKEVISEIVFNTSMTGYPEVLTDPSYCGEAVVMTYPIIGNYGVCFDDMESEKPWLDAFIVRELAECPSNFRSHIGLNDFLKGYDIPGIQGIDTRALTKILRLRGTMNGMITTNEDYDLQQVLPKINAFKAEDVVGQVTCREKKHFSDGTYKVALMDFGAKKNIARELAKRNCAVDIYPAYTPAEEILMTKPDGIMLSNGPGDPKDCMAIVAEIRKLFQSGVPMFGICLGHQLTALANGAETSKMKWGHRGANHPVKDLVSGRVYISSQNHGYVVDTKSIPEDVAEVSFRNANDATMEGLHYLNRNVFTVQFHPEASGGPQDTAFLFDRFINMMEVANHAEE